MTMEQLETYKKDVENRLAELTMILFYLNLADRELNK